MHPGIENSRVTWVRRACVTKGLRIFEPVELLKEALAGAKNPCVGWSGGKCSTAVLHMVLKLKPDITVLFIDTGVEFPEQYKFIKEISRSWKLNLKTFRPLTTYWEVVKKFGYPQFRTIGMDQDPNKKRPSAPRCCYELKEKTLKRAVREIGMDLNITGIRLAESRARTFLISGKGQFYFQVKNKFWNCHPIAFWTMKDLDAYLAANDIPASELYAKGQERTGCWPCTGYKTWDKTLAKTHPKMYEFVSHQIGQQLMTDYHNKEGCVNLDEDTGIF